MKKRVLAITVSLLTIVCIVFMLLHKSNNDPNKVLPQGEGLAVQKEDVASVTIGVGFIAVVKETGELWICVTDDELLASGYNDKSVWKLDDNVASATHLVTERHMESGTYDGPLLLGILYKDGTFWIWEVPVMQHQGGRPDFTQVSYTPKKIMEGVSSVTAGKYSFGVLKTNRTLWWISLKQDADKSLPYTEQINYRKGLSGVKAIGITNAENMQTYILKEGGTLLGYGENGGGQLGVGFKSGSAKRVYLDKITKITESVDAVITVGEQLDICTHTMAIKEDKSLWLWGYDSYFDFSDTIDFRTSYSPVKVMDDVATVALGGGHSLVIKNDKSLWAWGYNDYGQIGTGARNGEVANKPVHIMDSVIAISACGGRSFALQEDGTLWAFGANQYGKLGTGDTIDRFEPTQIMDDVASIKTTSSCSVAVKKDGSVWLWGHPTQKNAVQTDENAYISTPICILR